VECALEIQKKLKKENSKFVADKRLQFRIGVNIGDVVHDGDRIYGEGVNIAARIESLADADGICISRSTYDQIKNKLELDTEYLGEHEVKNIKEPVRVYKVLMSSEDAGNLIYEKSSPSQKKWPWLAVATVALLIGIIVWQFSYEKLPPIEAASVENMAYPLPDKPSIAVLPFDNMSGDPEQEYFSDGMTEDLITDLSKIPDLFVIGRNSTFTYKGKPIKIRQVAEELGVRYVLEGSVRKVENTVRINAQLIDATAGGHVWSERFDEEMVNIFSLQDKITHKIAEAMVVKLIIGEKETIPERETDSLEAYLKFLKGWQHYRQFTPTALLKAIPQIEKAIALDPNYWRAYSVLAKIYQIFYRNGAWRPYIGLEMGELKDLTNEYLELALKNPTPLAHYVATEMNLLNGDFEGAITEAKGAVSLDSNDSESRYAMGLALVYSGKFREAGESFKMAIRLDPFLKDRFGFGLARAYFHMYEFEKAAALCERAFKSNPEDYIPLYLLTASYGHLGREREAKAALAKLRELNPKWSYLRWARYGVKYKNIDDFVFYVDGLRKAGMEYNSE